MVESLCATTSIVPILFIFSKLSCINFSVSVSMFAVASSRSSSAERKESALDNNKKMNSRHRSIGSDDAFLLGMSGMPSIARLRRAKDGGGEIS